MSSNKALTKLEKEVLDSGFPDTICQWLYNKPKHKNIHRKRIGYIVATKEVNGMITFGWSKCASRDSFDFDLAKEIAYGRLEAGTNTPFPSCFKKFMPEFVLRCKKYFQSDLVQEVEFYDTLYLIDVPHDFDIDLMW